MHYYYKYALVEYNSRMLPFRKSSRKVSVFSHELKILSYNDCREYPSPKKGDKYMWLILFVLTYFILYSGAKKEIKASSESLALHIFGYYFLSVINFSINQFPIPLGFIIAMFLVNRTSVNNKDVKKVACYVGLILWFIGIFL